MTTSSNRFSVCLANVLVQFSSMAAVSPSGGSGDDYRLLFIKIKKSSFFCTVLWSCLNKINIYLYMYMCGSLGQKRGLQMTNRAARSEWLVMEVLMTMLLKGYF